MSKRPCAIFDMDGTLANVSSIRHHLRGPRKDFGKFHGESVNVPPNHDVVALAQDLHEQGIDIVIVTARKHMWRHHTAMWLALNDVPSVAMFMRHNNDGRKDVEVKRDILARIRQTWEPVAAIDDNPSITALWISEGIPTQIVPGWED